MGSWPKSWSTPHLMDLHQSGGRRWNWPWLGLEIRAGISVTLSGEATGPARPIVVDHSPHRPAINAPRLTPDSRPLPGLLAADGKAIASIEQARAAISHAHAAATQRAGPSFLREKPRRLPRRQARAATLKPWLQY